MIAEMSLSGACSNNQAPCPSGSFRHAVIYISLRGGIALTVTFLDGRALGSCNGIIWVSPKVESFVAQINLSLVVLEEVKTNDGFCGYHIDFTIASTQVCKDPCTPMDRQW